VDRSQCFHRGGGSLRAKYNDAVREIKETRRLLDEPVAAERRRSRLRQSSARR